MGLATLDKDNRDPLREDHRRRGSARLAHRRRPPRRDRPPRPPRRPGGGERGSASGRSASRRRDQRDAPFGGYPRGVLHQALGVRSELGEIRNAMTLTTITAMQRKNSTWPPQRGARAVARSHSWLRLRGKEGILTRSLGVIGSVRSSRRRTFGSRRRNCPVCRQCRRATRPATPTSPRSTVRAVAPGDLSGRVRLPGCWGERR